jgi:hypothetical protein
MEKEGLKKRKRVKKRKTSPRPSRTLGRQKKPGVSEHQKKLWADPEFRAMMMEKRRIQGEKNRGFAGRFGVPDGMRKKQAEQLNQVAAESAKETMADLKKAGVLNGEDPRSEEALEAAIKVMRKPGDKKVQLAAARLVLDFTKSKPATKTEMTVNKAEEWLKAITEDGAHDDGETSQDA